MIGHVLQKDDLGKLPLWVKLHGIPIEYWSERCLTYIASEVEKPLRSDRPTPLRSRVNYARVREEVEADKEPTKEFEFKGRDSGFGFKIDRTGPDVSGPMVGI